MHGWAPVTPRNSQSLKIVEKLGMTCEGILHSHIERQEERIDNVYYGVLRDEWGAARA